MIDLGPHWGFIVAAYGLAIIIVTGLTLWVIADYRGATRTLAELESRGLRRRSARKDERS